MKILSILLLSFLCSPVLAQYHLSYHIKYYSNDHKEEIEPANGFDPVWYDYYITDGYYKSISDGGKNWLEIYESRKNQIVYIKTDGEKESHDAALLRDGAKLIRIDEVADTTRILNLKCKAIKLIYETYTMTCFFNDSIKVEPDSFKNHNYGQWNQILSKTKGAIPLKFIAEYDKYTIEYIVESINREEFDADDFNASKALKKYQKHLESILEPVIAKFKENYSSAELDFINLKSIAMIGKMKLGQASFPMEYYSMKPHYQLGRTFIMGGTFLDGVSDTLGWSYNAMDDKVYRTKVDYESEYFDPFSEYKQLTQSSFDKLKVIHVKHLEAKNELRIVLAKEDERIIFNIDLNSYYFSRIEKKIGIQYLYDYKKFKGVPIPTKVIIKAENQDMTMLVDSVDFNKAYSLSLFEIPDSLTNRIEDKRNVVDAKEYYEKGEKNYLDQNYKQALVNYNAALEIEPTNGIYHNKIGLTKLKLNDNYGALTAFSSAIQYAPDFADAIYNLGYTKMLFGDNKKAILDFTKAIAMNETSPGYYNYRGLCYFNLNQYDSAILDFEKVIAIDSAFNIAYWNAGLSNYKNQNFSEAIPWFSSYIDKVGDKVEANNYRGICYFRMENYELALLDFEITVKSKEPVLNYFGNLARTYAKLENTKMAIHYFYKAIKLDTTYAEGFFEIGKLYISDNSYDEAIQNLDEAILLAPNKAEYFDYRGLAKYRKLDYLGSIEDYSSSINLYPKDGEIYYMRGLSKININDRFDACKDFKKSVDLGYEDGKESLAEYCK